jgi:hypothetical protein
MPLAPECAITPGMRAWPAIACLLPVLAGCGSSAKLPAGCNQGPDAIVKALGKAPAAVAIDGTPISGCFTRNASSDNVQIVGTNLLGAAEQLGDRARAGDPKAALQLGYLIGAAQRGSRRNGLGDELVRRLDAETTVAATGQAAYARGLRAGEAGG